MANTDRGEWNPNLVYRGTNDGTNFVSGDTVYWMGATFGALYYTIDSNPFYLTGWQKISGTVNTQPSVPSPIAALGSTPAISLSAFTDHSLTVSWNAAKVAGAGEVSSYNILVNGTQVGTTTGSGTSFTIPNLAAATSYQIMVTATDAYGTSGPNPVYPVGSTTNVNTAGGQNPVFSFTTAGSHISTGKYFSPYIDVGLPNYDLFNVSKSSGLTSFTLAFQNSAYSNLNPAESAFITNANGSMPALMAGAAPSISFGGLPAVNTPTGVLIDEVNQIQHAEGGTITVSIGGYTGIDPAVIAAQYAISVGSAKAAAALQGQYQSVMNTFGVTHLDFDIETEQSYTYTDSSGAHFTNDPSAYDPTVVKTHQYTVANDTAANALRNTAIVALEAANPGMGVTFTVATNTTGLSSDGSSTSYGGDVLDMIKIAIASGVRIDALNLMVMDFNSTDTVNGSPDQADRAIAAANAVHAQFPNLKIALTPMIGQNDSKSGVTTLDDVARIAAFADANSWVVGTGLWQLGRDQSVDHGNGNISTPPTAANLQGTQYGVQTYQSGVAETQWQFSSILQSSTSINKAANPNDFDHDGRSDIVWRNTNSGQTTEFTTEGGGAGVYLDRGTVGSQYSVVGSGDFDGDKSADILFRNTSTGEVGEWLSSKGSGPASYVKVAGVGTDWVIQGVGDFDGDGKADILWRNSNSGDTGAWLSSKGAGSAGYQQYASVGSAYQIQGVGDIDGDGKADVLWRNSTGEVGAWESSHGTGTSSYVTLATNVGSTYQIVGTGDFDGDGKMDVLFRVSNTGEVGEWLSSKGTGTAGWQSFGTVGSDWQIQGTGDFDGDGKADVLWRNTSTGEVGAWESSHGTGTASYVKLAGVGLDWQILHLNGG